MLSAMMHAAARHHNSGYRVFENELLLVIGL
jgi:hypothetical protein